MSRQSFSSGAPWETKYGYTRAVKVNNIIEVAGTVASKDGEVQCKGDAYGQSKFILDIIINAVVNLGGSVKDIVRTRIYCTDIRHFDEIGRVHGEVFGEIKPAMAIVEVSKLIHPDMLVEIEATAIIPQ